MAFVAALPLIVTTPVTSMALYATLGASVEPFFYVIALWWLRRRPLAFGVLLCLGTLHREFTILTLPALAAVHLVERRPVRWPAVGRGAAAFAGNVARNRCAEALAARRLATQEAQTIGGWLSSDVAGYLARLQSLVTAGIPALFGCWRDGTGPLRYQQLDSRRLDRRGRRGRPPPRACRSCGCSGSLEIPNAASG